MHSPPSEWDYLKAWSCYVVCSIVAGLLLDFFGNIFVSGIQSFFSAPIPYLRSVAAITAIILGICGSYACFRLFVHLFLVRNRFLSATGDVQSAA